MSGKSLQPLLTNAAVKDWRSDSLHSFNSGHKTIPNWEGVRNKRYVYARYYDQKPPYEMLHDLEKDPQQLKNFAQNPEYAAILKQMRKRCDDLIKDEVERGKAAQ